MTAKTAGARGLIQAINDFLADPSERNMGELDDYAVNILRSYRDKMGWDNNDLKRLLKEEMYRINKAGISANDVRQYWRLRRDGSEFPLDRLARTAVFARLVAFGKIKDAPAISLSWGRMAKSADPADEAAMLLKDWRSVEALWTRLKKSWERALKDQIGLERAGAGTTEAPNLLRVVVKPDLVRLVDELQEINAYIDALVRDSGRSRSASGRAGILAPAISGLRRKGYDVSFHWERGGEGTLDVTEPEGGVTHTYYISVDLGAGIVEVDGVSRYLEGNARKPIRGGEFDLDRRGGSQGLTRWLLSRH